MTIGLSPKAVLAFAFPLIASIGGALVSWIATGDFNTAEIRTALGGLITSGLALLGAYIGQPGNVQTTSHGFSSDELMAPGTIEKLS